MKLLSLNCQKAYQPNFYEAFADIIERDTYDFLILQEITGEVYAWLTTLSGYTFISCENPDTRSQSHLVIGFRDGISYKEHHLVSFIPFLPDSSTKPWSSSHGLLTALFMYEGAPVTIGSMHLHAGLDTTIRKKELSAVKSFIDTIDTPILFGGDCNFGFPGELKGACSEFGENFGCITHAVGPTLDSRYTENSASIPNKVSLFLSTFGLGIRLKTDHIFVDKGTLSTKEVSCRVLPDRLSDHSPLEFELH